MPEMELMKGSSDSAMAAGKGSLVGASQQNPEQGIPCVESNDVDSVVDAGQPGLQSACADTSPPNHISTSTRDTQGLYTVPILEPFPQANSLTGWAKVEKALTEFDQQDVGAYKEDIDSLLVFAGLYSAVLTAFVIVSYPQLQEDTASETLQVLRLIANQTATYTILGGQLINSTTTASIPTPVFQPSPTAIRINVLWFASLVISLSTASFAILVKQWLRAYLAFASASPQGQLRVRHFRRGGLETWKVFTIASILPLLLQISLSLFFIGLCYFSIDIHPSIGNTALPLVCAWAFLFIAVTLAPVFSVRCPYKTPALAPVAALLRNRIHPYLAAAVRLYSYLATWWLACTVLFHRTITRLGGYLTPLIPRWKRFIVPDAILNFCSSRKGTSEHIIVRKPLEESDIIKDASRDLDILLSADALQADDRLLETTMAVALEHSNSHWTEIVEFLVRVIGNRVPLTSAGSGDPFTYKPMIVDFCSISQGVRKAIIDALEVHVGAVAPLAYHSYTNQHDTPRRRLLVEWVVCLTMSAYQRTSTPLPQTLLNIARTWFYEKVDFKLQASYSFGNGEAVENSASQLMLPLTCMFAISWGTYDQEWRKDIVFMDKALRMSEITFEKLPALKQSSSRQWVLVAWLLQKRIPAIQEMVEDAAKSLADKLVECTQDTPLLEDVAVLHDAMALTIRLFGIAFNDDGVGAIERRLQLLTPAMEKLLSFKSETGMQTVVLSYLSQSPRFIDLYHWIICVDGDYPFLADVMAGVTDMDPHLNKFHLLNLSYLALAVVHRATFQTPSQWSIDRWRATFNTLASALSSTVSIVHKSKHRKGPSVREAEIIQHMASHAWYMIRHITGRRQPDYPQCHVPDYFCLIFAEAVDWQHADTSYRAGYLRGMGKEQRDRLRVAGEQQAEIERGRRRAAQSREASIEAMQPY